MPTFDWYSLTDSPEVEQGDILQSCLAPLPPRLEHDEDLSEDVDQYDRVVVLSQSCDLADRGIRRVMVCPLYEIEEFLAAAVRQLPTKVDRKSIAAELLRGRRIAHHLMNRCTLKDAPTQHLVADFGDAFSVPFAYIDELVEANGPRLRLLPPYREHLAQAFARFYMRIGLPTQVDKIP